LPDLVLDCKDKERLGEANALHGKQRQCLPILKDCIPFIMSTIKNKAVNTKRVLILFSFLLIQDPNLFLSPYDYYY
jgi:hypothetical protein